ncbi:DUF116 domain-containing protein [candidate division KSB1 bacterium]|nr:DUF116 domain-containing protein [candidate division KSB1 bacterium]
MTETQGKNTIRLQVQERKLGDEWAGWDGCLDEKAINSDAQKRLFIGFAVLALVLFSGFALLFWYLIQPRIWQMSTALAQGIGFVILGGVLLFGFWLFLNILSIILEKNLLLQIFRYEFSFTFLAPMVMRLSQRFGISKDLMANSFIKVNNALTRLAKKHLHTVKLVVLLPHCLQRTLRQKLMNLGEKYQIGIYIAPGGSVARKIITDCQPNAVIAVACERDLIAGIQDIFLKIPVIGVPNQRPEGPCKNTLVNFDDVENAIKFFLQR